MSAAAIRRVTAVMVNFRTPDLAATCIRALAGQRTADFAFDLILIDNGSGDGSAEKLDHLLADLIAEHFVQFVPLDLNGGFGWANNEAMLRAFARPVPPDAIFLINPDCVPEPGAVAALVAELDRFPDCGVAGSQLVNADGSLTGSAFRFHATGSEFIRGLGLHSVGRLFGVQDVLIPYGQAGVVDWVTGASCLLRAEALREVGLFDTGFFLYFEEVELMHRMGRAGWTVRHVPQSQVMHIGGVATGLSEGKSRAETAMPAYWYESRRRFFTLTGGSGQAWRASFAWLAGARIGRLIAPVVPGDRIPVTRGDETRLRQQGLRSTANDMESAITRIGDVPGVPPRWMNKAA